ncbi:hypothetical protein ZWY2020_043622 [Hordeum vulgare]|nr:hypothetical protein ZWY2020_043622 [Hordeum vulgare]
MASPLSPFTRTSIVTKPRQLAPTVGPAHGGVEVSKEALPGFGSYVVGLMTKSPRRKYYIDNSSWGPEAGSIISGYRIPFGNIHVFISKIGTPVPESDIYTDIVEPARLAQPATPEITRHRIFVGFTQRANLPDEPKDGGDTPVNSDGESSIGDTDSICPLYEGKLGGFPEAAISEGPEEPPPPPSRHLYGRSHDGSGPAERSNREWGEWVRQDPGSGHVRTNG